MRNQTDEQRAAVKREVPPAPGIGPVLVLFGVLGAALFFFGVALSKFEKRMAEVELILGIERDEIIEDFR